MRTSAPKKANTANNVMWLAASPVVLLLFGVFLGGCSPQSNSPQERSTHRRTLPEDRTAALARDNNCAILPREIRKSVGTNTVYSIDVQRVLSTNKRLTATCYLIDLVQAGEHAHAVFEIGELELGAWSGTCVVRLECATNFVPTLASDLTVPDWAVAFEVTSNRHDLQFTKGPGDDDVVKVWSVLTIEGKLLGLQDASH